MSLVLDRIVAEIRAGLRAEFEPTNRPVQEGSALFEKLRKVPYEPDIPFRRRYSIYRNEDERLDDPRHGQAEWINR